MSDLIHTHTHGREVLLQIFFRTNFGTQCDFKRTGWEQCKVFTQEGIAFNVNQCYDTRVS